jgi:hypothetical protein
VRHCGGFFRFGRDPKLDMHALALDVAQCLQPSQHGLRKRIVRWIETGGRWRKQQSDLRHALLLLGLRGGRHGASRCAKRRHRTLADVSATAVAAVAWS